MKFPTTYSFAALLAVIMLNASVVLAQDWQRQSPFPADDYLNDVHLISDVVTWIVGDDGIVMRTTDAGITWQQHPDFPRSPFSAEDALNQVQFVDSQAGFIGGNNVFRSVDGGENWVDMGFHGQVRRMQFVTPDVGFIATNGGLRRTTDGAQTFATVFNVVSHLSFLNENDGIVSSGGDLFRTENGGDTWSMVSTMGMTRLLMVDQDIVIGSGLNDLFRSDDGGATWTVVATSQDNFSDITRIDNNSVAAVDIAGGIFVSDDGGSNWTQTQVTIGSWAPSGSVHFAPNGSVGFSALSGGVLLKSSDAGQTWTEISSGAAVPLFDIQMTDAGFGIAVGAGLTVLRTTDYGRKWHARTIEEPSIDDLNVVQIIDSNTIVVAGENSAFYRSEDGGQTWSNLTGNLPGGWDWNGISFVDENLGWLFGRNFTAGAIYHTTDGGQNWNRLLSSGTLGEGEMVTPDVGWAVNFQNHLFTTQNNWASWQRDPIASNDIFFELDLVDENVGWVIGVFEKIGKSVDGGQSFEFQAHPGYDEDEPERDQIEDIFAINENEVYLAMRNEPGIQYCTIHRSTDGGNTWTALSPCGDSSNQFGGRVGEITVLPTGEIWVASVTDGFIWASDVEFEPPAAEIVGIETITGVILDGEPGDLESSDDAYVHARSGFRFSFRNLHNMELVVDATTGVAAPSSIDVTVESHIAFMIGSGVVSLRNWNTGKFDSVGSFMIGMEDQVKTISDIDADNYVNESGEIELSLKHRVFIPRFFFRFESFVDQIEILVR